MRAELTRYDFADVQTLGKLEVFENDNKVACPMCGEKGPKRVMSKTFTKGSAKKGNLTFPT